MRSALLSAMVIALIGSSASAVEQSVSVRAAVGSWISYDEITFGESGYAYNRSGLALEGTLSYRTYEDILVPFAGVIYRFDDLPGATSDLSMGRLDVKNMLIHAGISKPFEVGYSTMELGMGIGYCLRTLEIDGGDLDLLTIERNGPAFIGHLTIRFPFFERVDASFTYRVVFNAGGIEDGNYGPIYYHFELADLHQILSFGLSYFP